MTPKREALNKYTESVLQMELAEIAIEALSKMRGKTPERCIKSLKFEQQRALKRMDAMAEKLGAPYGA